MFQILISRNFLWILVIACVFASLPGFAQNNPTEVVDSSYEGILIAEEDDTFSSIALRELGSLQLARALAEYNQLPFDTVFPAGQELQFPTQITPKSNHALVAFVKGEASYHPASSQQWQRALSRDDKLFTTDVVKTGTDGYVSLKLSSGTVVNIQPNSTVQLNRLNCLPDDDDCIVTLDVEEGQLDSNVSRREKQHNRFTIETPYASASVRGTVFDFDAGSKRMRLGVTEGDVSVNSESIRLTVESGYGVLVNEGQMQGDVTRLLTEPLIGTLPPRVSDEDVLAWREVEGGSVYKVTFTHDALGNEVALEAEVADLNHPLEALEPGTHFVTVRAVDSEGFLGHRQRAVLEKVAFDKTLEVPRIEGVHRNNDLFLSAFGGPEKSLYEFQLANDADFSSIVSVDVPVTGGVLHELEDGTINYARVRTIKNDGSVSSYSPVSVILPDGSLEKL